MALISKTKSYLVCGPEINRGKTAFSQLVKDLRDALGSVLDLCFNDIGLDHILELMRLYTSSESEWSRYAFVDPASQYVRNLVDEGNGRSNLVCKH
jgi:cysteine dioxygenase